jgi:hypothetical protein
LTSSKSPVTVVNSEVDNEKPATKPVVILNNSLNRDENSKPGEESSKSMANGKLEPATVKSSTTSMPPKNGLISGTTLLSQQTPKIVNKEPINQIISSSVEKTASTSNPLSLFVDSINNRLTAGGSQMSTPVKLLDENLQWQEGLGDYLNDQTDYVVIGVLGKKGVGKSTIMSLLGGTPAQKVTQSSNCLFRTATKDVTEQAQNKTNGINAFVTSERTILLDVQVSFLIY